ncbi:MAG: hypothetical protein ACRD1U_13060 [Vicinamibacterales bacterium]
MAEPEIPSPSERLVRNGLAAAERRRRAREASRRLWRAAPAVASAILLVAALAWWAGWRAIVPLSAFGLGAAGLGIFAVVARRRHDVSDTAATAIDADASMGGELRSAAWFAARTPRDEWAEFHLHQAAERIARIDWEELYPTIRPRRAQLVTATIMAGALALALTIPERAGLGSNAALATSRAPGADRAPTGSLAMLTPEMQRQLEALLAAAEGNDTSRTAALAGDAELQALLDKLGQLRDPETLEALARAMANQNAAERSAAEDMQALADRARRAAESASLTPRMKEALDKLSDELQIARSEQAGENAGNEATAPGSEGDRADSNAASGAQDVTIQFAKQADAGGGAGVVMMSSPEKGNSGGAPGGGVGGAGSDETTGATTKIEAALKQEIVEASQDNPGAQVETDIRRKTEHGDATVAFTNSAAASFDKARTSAPPPVPEARRPGVQTYFVRKSQ